MHIAPEDRASAGGVASTSGVRLLHRVRLPSARCRAHGLLAGAGIAILSWPTLEPDVAGPERDLHAERIAVHANALDNNGFDPGGAPEDPFTHVLERSGRTELADVVWDGALGGGGELQTLCVRDDADASFLDLGARDGFALISEDASAHDRAQPAP